MSSPTFPTPDPDAPDPVGGNDGDPQSPQSPQSPETPEPCDEEDSAAYLEELMAAVAAGEELTAGDISGAGFGQDGTAQQCTRARCWPRWCTPRPPMRRSWRPCPTMT